MIDKLGPYLDFWVESQRKGFATGELEKTELPDGSSLIEHYRHPLRYTDHWYGSEVGRGYAVLDKLERHSEGGLELFKVPPIASLGYSWDIAKFTKEELTELQSTFDDMSDLKIIFGELKLALSCVTRERPLRGPEVHQHPQCKFLIYTSRENDNGQRIIGEEEIRYHGALKYRGNYDFLVLDKHL